MLCDFCSDRVKKHWRYPARSFVADVTKTGALGIAVQESVGDWCACQVCHDLIEAGKRTCLVRRSVDCFYDTFGRIVSRNELETTLYMFQSQFFDNRKGPAVEEEDPEEGSSTVLAHIVRFESFRTPFGKKNLKTIRHLAFSVVQ